MCKFQSIKLLQVSTFRVGVIMSGENAIVYKFLYKNDDKVGSNKEILDGLISSMEVDSMKVSMEK